MRNTDWIPPAARTQDLLTQVLPDEIVVYDVLRHEAICLNTSAALIWKRCDGKTTVGELARFVESTLGISSGEEFVWFGLNQLTRFHLLTEDGTPIEMSPAITISVSRRELVNKLGTAALLAIPTIIALNVPDAAAQGSTGFGGTGPLF